MKRVVAALGLTAALLINSACEYKPDRLMEKVRAAINWVTDPGPPRGFTSCSVTIFDQQIDPATNTTYFTPVYPPAPELIYAWWTTCFGAGNGTHSVRTFKASGYTQGGDPAKNAVCWATQPVPNGAFRFPCAIDTREDFNWVKSLKTSFNGVIVVGAF